MKKTLLKEKSFFNIFEKKIKSKMLTIRQQIISLLCENQMDAKEISKAVSIKEKEVYKHLPNIERSVKAQKKKLIIKPFNCMVCGFVFKERKRLNKPGRCPKCKNGQLEAASYKIL